MAEQNQASNPPQAPPPERNAPVGDSGAAGATVPAYPRRRSQKRVILLASLVVLVIGGVSLWLYFSRFESTDDAQVDVHLYPVSARISGYIQKVNVEDNQWVEGGSTLVEIDPKDNEVALPRAQADLDNADAAAPHSRADAWRLDYRQLFLALDLFHYLACGSRGSLFDVYTGRRSTVPPPG